MECYIRQPVTLWYVIELDKCWEAISDSVVREEFPAMLTAEARSKQEGDSCVSILEKNLQRPSVKSEPEVLGEQKPACWEHSTWAVGQEEIKSQRQTRTDQTGQGEIFSLHMDLCAYTEHPECGVLPLKTVPESYSIPLHEPWCLPVNHSIRQTTTLI